MKWIVAFLTMLSAASCFADIIPASEADQQDFFVVDRGGFKETIYFDHGSRDDFWVISNSIYPNYHLAGVMENARYLIEEKSRVISNISSGSIQEFIYFISKRQCIEGRATLVMFDGFGTLSPAGDVYEFVGIDMQTVSLGLIANILSKNVKCKYVVAVVDAKKYGVKTDWPVNVAVIFASSGKLHFDNGKVDTFVEALAEASTSSYSSVVEYVNRINGLVRFPIVVPEWYAKFDVDFPPRITVEGGEKWEGVVFNGAKP